ncbi:MAG TPA: ABC transporter ATP-binding protein [Mycobacterium sp.]|nr:ABC transporter ATP-binding protein [Mycobacterium sp.]
MSDPVLIVEGLTVCFGGDAPVVSDLSLTVHPGQTVAIVGESGSGKTTTAAAVLGLLPAGGRITAGRIVFGGTDIAGLSTRGGREISRGIGYVPQDPMTNLNPVWKVGFQVREALRAHGIRGRSEARAQALRLLDEVGMPDPPAQVRRYPHQMSGGMCQRALIAIGLAGNPRLLIADEPTSALDVTVQRQVLDHLQAMAAERGTAVLLITHDLGLAAQRAAQVVVMRAGRVVESGPAQRIFSTPEHEYTQRLVASAPAVQARGHRVATVTPASGEPIVVADNLTKVYRVPSGNGWRHSEFTALDAVSFRVRRGSTMAIVGESGSGKSTLARLMLGLAKPTAGSVTVGGVDVAALSRDRDHQRRLSFRGRVQPVFQNPYSSLDPMFSVSRLIEEPLRVHRVGDRGARQRLVRELLDDVGLPQTMLARRPRELSGGQRQRVAIARALVLRPELLVLDEAVSALDVIVQAQILQLLVDLQARLGLSYVFISHDLGVVRQIADEVLVMRAGRVIESGTVEEVFDAPRTEYTRALLAAIPGRVGRRD